MMIRSLKRTCTKSARNEKSGWLWRAGNRQFMNQRELKRRNRGPSDDPERQTDRKSNPDLCVEGIEVSADNNFMYCKGCVRSRGNRSGSQVVVAVEWLDRDRKALNTNWKRIGMHMDGESVPLLTNTLQPFTIRAPLDRRVKWVQAYAFSGDR